MESRFSVAVLIISPEGIPLVKDPKKPAPHYWKLPGGRSEGSETAEECAMREIREELGLEIDQDDLHVIEEQDRGSHALVFFRIEVPSLAGLKKEGDEREAIGVFKISEILRLPDFFPNHKNIVQAETGTL